MQGRDATDQGDRWRHMFTAIRQWFRNGWQDTYTDLKGPILGIFVVALAVATIHGIDSTVVVPHYWASLATVVVGLGVAFLINWPGGSAFLRIPLQLLALLLAGGAVAWGGGLDHLALLFVLPLMLAALLMRSHLRLIMQGLTVLTGTMIATGLGGELPWDWLAALLGIMVTANLVVDRILETLKLQVGQARHFRLVSETVQALINPVNEDILERFCHQAVKAFQAHECVLFLVNDQRTMLVPQAYAMVDGYREHYAHLLAPISVETGLTGWVYRTGEAVLTGDAVRDPRAFVPPNARFSDFSAFFLPVRSDSGAVRGVLRIYRLGVGQYSQDAFELAKLWANEVGLVLQKAELYQRMEQMALTDALTGTYNRHYLTERWPIVVDECRSRGSKVVLLMIDCFDFKRVNDRYGHTTGDRLLRELGRTLLEETPPGGFTVRYGGDEFLIVLPHATEADGHALKEQIQSRLSLANVARTSGPALTIDMGVYAAAGGDLDHLLLQVDMDLYQERDDATYERLRSLLENSVSERSKHMVQAVMSLTKIQEMNDPYTRGHAERAKAIAMRTAVHLGLTPEEVQLVGFGAVLHDVGKIVVPQEILNKPGALTAEEWRIMRMHPVFGANIVGELDILRAVKPLILHHHERFDGVVEDKHPGYPAGLKGEEIPIGARIIAVVDAFDAMTTDRVYRKGRPIETAMAELRRMSGTQFDPRVVEAFEQVLYEMVRENATWSA